MKLREMKSAIEGMLFVSGDEGIDVKSIAEVLEIDVHLASDLILELKKDLVQSRRGVQIVEVAGSYQLTTLPEHASIFEKLAHSPGRSTLSQAALETLSIIAYKQPLTRIDIEEIRGVKSDRALQTLMGKDLIKEVGRAEAVGRPILYGTSKQFLEYFGLKSIDELPDSSVIEGQIDLEAETRMLFEKLDNQQMTFEDMDKSQSH
ncbi:SMC-Scp complex subunit ScpB [Paenibacillus albiflavus]|uniref:Segregation and condensation protein B n=1 Tax=Paenibacillus albiflavus TaxID=2545760 RepID=A0A4V2WPZ0_9BACL|nr:SMC-Scp complex subunit ScpB [Paenibacillus albiflavus]TCZ81262.1 SMC-Scp complex subunit ScpB [Paenibacillus albiflavus]